MLTACLQLVLEALVPWVLIRLTAAPNPCQSPFESSLYQSNQLKGPCRASEETKAGSLLGTWDFIPNADQLR